MLKILIPAFSSPLLLETQLQAVKAYLPTAEIWVVIDTKPGILSATRRRMIESAQQHTPYVVEFPEKLHLYRRRIHPHSKRLMSRSPSMRHADVLQYCFNKMNLNHNFELLILDEDLIPFKPWTPQGLLGGGKFGLYVPQTRFAGGLSLVYPWPGLFYADLSQTSQNEKISWDIFQLGDMTLDSGGNMNEWISVNSTGFTPIIGLHSNQWSVRNVLVDLPESIRVFLDLDVLPSGNNFAELYSESFIHLRGSSNWFRHDPKAHSSRLQSFCLSIQELLNRSTA